MQSNQHTTHGLGKGWDDFEGDELGEESEEEKEDFRAEHCDGVVTSEDEEEDVEIIFDSTVFNLWLSQESATSGSLHTSETELLRDLATT